MAKVFVSHRRADAARAEALASEIRSAGHDVWLDDWEIGIGNSIVGRMQDGLQNTAYLVLCYSTERGVLAPWVSREWMSALSRQLEGAEIKLLPAKLTDGGSSGHPGGPRIRRISLATGTPVCGSC